MTCHLIFLRWNLMYARHVRQKEDDSSKLLLRNDDQIEAWFSPSISIHSGSHVMGSRSSFVICRGRMRKPLGNVLSCAVVPCFASCRFATRYKLFLELSVCFSPRLIYWWASVFAHFQCSWALSRIYPPFYPFSHRVMHEVFSGLPLPPMPRMS